MKEQDLRALLADNIKKFRAKRGWSQLKLSEKLDISTNFLSEIENGKGWVSPLTLVKLASALDVEVFELFKPDDTDTKDNPAAKKMKRFAKDMTLALEASADESLKSFKKTIDKVCKEYLG